MLTSSITLSDWLEEETVMFVLISSVSDMRVKVAVGSVKRVEDKQPKIKPSLPPSLRGIL